MNKKLLLSIKIGLWCVAIGATCGIVFGLSSMVSKTEYVDLSDANHNRISYKEATPIATQKIVDGFKNEGITKENFGKEIIDGSNHQVLDKSFNQGAYKGVYNFDQYFDSWDPSQTDTISHIVEDELTRYYNGEGASKWAKPTNDQPDGFVQTYKSAIDAGYKNLVLPGYLHSTPLLQLASQGGIFKNAGYVLIDSSITDENYASHIASVMFRADQSAFLAALSVCDYLSLKEKNFEHYIKKGPLAVGTFGGTSIPTVTIFMGGFERGINFFNTRILPKINQTKLQPWSKEELEQHKVNVISLGKSDSYFSGTFTIGDGRSIVQTLLARGADAIMPVAGPQTIDTVQEIKNQKSDCIVVGVDTDQENSDMNEKSVYMDEDHNDNIIKFSAEKNIAYMTSAILYLSKEEKAAYPNEQNPTIGSYGYLTIGDLDNSGCKVSDDGKPYIEHMAPKTYSGYDSALSWLKNELGIIEYINNNMYFSF